MPSKLLISSSSAPTRAVLMTAKLLDEELDTQEMDETTTEAEDYGQDYEKINPQHCVPTLIEEDGFTLWESRAICAYLCNKSRESNPEMAEQLYPSADIQQRARVDGILHWDAAYMSPAVADFADLLLRKDGEKQRRAEEVSRKYQHAMDTLKSLLKDQDWVAGTEQMTIADLSLYASLSLLKLLDPEYEALSSADPDYPLTRWTTAVIAAIGVETDKVINVDPLEQLIASHKAEAETEEFEESKNPKEQKFNKFFAI